MMPPTIFREHSTFPDLSYVALSVSFGSGDEAPDAHGLAHLLEHVLVRARLESSPQVVAKTSRDRTTYSAVTQTKDLNRVIPELTSVLLPLSVESKPLLSEELLVVAREKIERKANTLWRAREATLSRLWAGGAYSRDSLGSSDSLRRLSFSDLISAHAREYQPHNAVVVVVGPDEAREFVSKMPVVETFRQPKPAAPLPSRPRVLDLSSIGPELGISMCWRTHKPHSLAVELLNMRRNGMYSAHIPVRGDWLFWLWIRERDRALERALSEFVDMIREVETGRTAVQVRGLALRSLQAKDRVESVGIDLVDEMWAGEAPSSDHRSIAKVLRAWRDHVARELD